MRRELPLSAHITYSPIFTFGNFVRVADIQSGTNDVQIENRLAGIQVVEGAR
jgi:hypothetical protein